MNVPVSFDLSGSLSGNFSTADNRFSVQYQPAWSDPNAQAYGQPVNPSTITLTGSSTWTAITVLIW